MDKSKNAKDENDALKSLTQQYNAAAKKSCGAHIAMAETVLRARDALTRSNFDHFCKGVRLDPKGSTVRKMKTIAKASARLSHYLPLLPDGWTTLWQLSRQAPEDLERLKASGALHPHATWAELKNALRPGSKKQNKKSPKEWVYFDFTAIPYQRRQDLLNRLTEVGKDFDVKPQLTHAGEAMLKRLKGVPNGTDNVQERAHETV